MSLHQPFGTQPAPAAVINPDKVTWRGKLIETMTHEELVQAMISVCRQQAKDAEARRQRVAVRNYD